MKRICLSGSIFIIAAVISVMIHKGVPGVPASGAVAQRQTTVSKADSRQTVVPESWAMSEAVKKITGAETADRERLLLIHALPLNLTEYDRACLYEYIRTAPNNSASHVAKNDLLNKLRNQENIPAELTGKLLALVYDRDQDIVIRSYALQHMRPWYEVTGDEALKQGFYDALSETETEMAGNALLALRHLTQEYPDEFDRERIGGAAEEIFADPDCCILSRISAVQVAGMLKRETILPAVREVIQGCPSHTALRLASIASLGEIGDASDIAFLETVASDSPLMAPAVNRTILKLRDKR